MWCRSQLSNLKYGFCIKTFRKVTNSEDGSFLQSIRHEGMIWQPCDQLYAIVKFSPLSLFLHFCFSFPYNFFFLIPCVLSFWMNSMLSSRKVIFICWRLIGYCCDFLYLDHQVINVQCVVLVLLCSIDSEKGPSQVTRASRVEYLTRHVWLASMLCWAELTQPSHGRIEFLNHAF